MNPVTTVEAAAMTALEAEIAGDNAVKDAAVRFLVAGNVAKDDLLGAVAVWTGAACQAVGKPAGQRLALNVALGRSDMQPAVLSLVAAMMCAVHNSDWAGAMQAWRDADDAEVFEAAVRILKIAGDCCRRYR